MIARTLNMVGLVLWLPPAIGVVARFVVDGYKGEASGLLWAGIALFAVSALVEWHEKRRAKKAPVDLDYSIYDWDAGKDGVTFYARREDGSEHVFTVARGATATRKAGAGQ